MSIHTRGRVLSLTFGRKCLFFLVFCVFLFVLHLSSATSKYDRENWVNPHDMLNYDRSTKTMKRKKFEERSPGWENDHREFQETSADVTSETCERYAEFASELRAQLTACETFMENLKETQPTSHPEPALESPDSGEKTHKRIDVKMLEIQYMRRFVNILLQVTGLTKVKPDVGSVKQAGILVDVSDKHLVKLQQFASGSPDVTLGELDDILSNILYSANMLNMPAGWIDGLLSFLPNNMMHYIFFFFLVFMVVKMYRSPMLLICVVVLILVFQGSYDHTYNYLVKKAEIDHITTMKKYTGMPAFCRPPESWTEHVWTWLSRDAGECRRWHEAVMMDPSLRISTIIVLAEMLSSTLLHPAGSVGEAISKFSSGVLGNLSTFTGLPILLFCLVTGATVLILIVLLCFGRGLRLWSLFGGVEIGGQLRVVPQERQAVQDIPSPPVGPSSSSTDPPKLSNVQVTAVTDLPGHEHPSMGRGEKSAVCELLSHSIAAEKAANEQSRRSIAPASPTGRHVPSTCVDPLAGGDVGRAVSTPDSDLDTSARLETSHFIEEVRKILEEDSSFDKDSSRVLASSDGEMGEGDVCGDDGHYDDVSVGSSKVAPRPGCELKKQGSSDGSDESEEFVKV